MRAGAERGRVPRRVVLALAVAGSLVAGAGRPCAQEDEVPLELRVPRMDGAVAQLAHARRLKARAFREEGDEARAFWRGLAIEAYRAVRTYHPGARALGAEGAFRAGELLRADERLEAARAEFEAAVQLGLGTAFHARGRLELGHLSRRAGEHRVALDHYLAVASDGRSAAAHREDAWLWAGRTWWERGAHEEARRAWRGVVERAVDPFLVLRAHDELASAWVAVGDLEAAAGQLEACRLDLAPALLEETERGERLVEAYRRMRSRDALRSALEARRASGARDARDESVQAWDVFVRESLDTKRRMFHRGA